MAASPGTITGNCNAQGVNISVTCTMPAPASLARITVEGAPIDRFWFDGPPDRLPTPPGFQSPGAQCQDWDPWIKETPTFYYSQPETDFSIEAGEPDLIVVNSIDVLIYERTQRPAGSGTWVQCAWGGGALTFYNVTVDTVKRETRVWEDVVAGGDTEDPKPAYVLRPGSITLSEKGFANVRIGIESQPGYKYSGSLVIKASVNGKAVTYTIGSKDKPLRWTTPAPGESPDTVTEHGWDDTRRRWVRGYNPYGT